MSRKKRATRGQAARPATSTVPTTPSIGPMVRRTGRWWLAGLAAALVAAGTWWLHKPAAPAPDVASTAPVQALASTAPPPGAYVDNRLCLGCHQDQAEQWRQSHHAMAMAAPTAASVRGNFDNRQFRHQGLTSRFFRRGDQFLVRTDGPDGKPGDFEIRYTFGVAPLQQYLIGLPGGRLQALQIAWDTGRKGWFHLLPKEKAPPGDVLHWTGRYQTANTMCIACHTTGYEKRYDADQDRFDSRWSEPNVSCQACHGPGERHAQWAQLRAAGKAAPPGDNHGLAVASRNAGGKQHVEMCAACHSRRSELTAAPLPGQPRLDHYLPALLTEGLYHADGQQHDEVYVDGSYRQSRMYQAGVGCANCHNPHTGKLKVAGNGLCLECHAAQAADAGSKPAPGATPANPAFAAAAGHFDTPAHHFHQPGSPGAQCVNCHMPAKTYMQVQARPDHSLRVPRPDLTVKIGTPNACNTCHTDKGAQWAADQVVRWYGPRRKQGPHYGEAFAAARAGRPGAGEALIGLASDARQPGIVRATALAALRGDGATGLTARLAATRDADPEVRAAAADSYEAVPAAQRVYALAPLLADPLRAVRIAAAKSLSTLAPEQIGAAHRPAFDTALVEYVAAQSVSLDMPGARLNLAVVYENTGRTQQAEQHYLAALAIDPDFTPARANLARMYNGMARNADAERVLREGLTRRPGIGELQYSLGLLLAEDQRIGEAAEALARAAKLMPDRARVHYNLGLALQQLQRRNSAEAALLTAQRLDPADTAAPYALAVFYAQGGQRKAALEWAQKLQALAPADPRVARLVARLAGGQ